MRVAARISRRSGAERPVMLGYFEDGPNLVTMAMNGWADAEPRVVAQPAGKPQRRQGAVRRPIREVSARHSRRRRRTPSARWERRSANDKALESLRRRATVARNPGRDPGADCLTFRLTLVALVESATRTPRATIYASSQRHLTSRQGAGGRGRGRGRAAGRGQQHSRPRSPKKHITWMHKASRQGQSGRKSNSRADSG